MNTEQIRGMWHYLGMVHGVTAKAVAKIPAAKLDWRPTPETRSFRELVTHLYAQERISLRGVVAGAMTPEDHHREESGAPNTVEGLVEYGKEIHAESTRIVNTLTDADLQKTIKAYGMEFPAWQLVTGVYDEHWHHRGQLYTYLRLAGVEPPLLYDYPPMP
jgi:uncharacterized damage-inducible protein DinB